MRVNKFVALATGMSRREADTAIINHRVKVGDRLAQTGQEIEPKDIVTLDGQRLKTPPESTVLMLNKPSGYVCSRQGQGSKTIYDLLPKEFHTLKPVGRLDKDSSGLLLLTNDGQLAHELTHPSFQKEKVYEVSLDKSLQPNDQIKINEGVELEDGVSHMKIKGIGKTWTVTMSEGRNRQIRRTFAALDYRVTQLHRNQFGPYVLKSLSSGEYSIL